MNYSESTSGSRAEVGNTVIYELCFTDSRCVFTHQRRKSGDMIPIPDNFSCSSLSESVAGLERGVKWRANPGTAIYARRAIPETKHLERTRCRVALVRRMSKANNFVILNGRGERIRTSDPLLPKQVLYQAEPLPEHGYMEHNVGARPGAFYPFNALQPV